MGIVSERDVVRQLHEHGPELLRKQVGDIMSSEVLTCCPDDNIDDLAALMTNKRIRHIPVLDGGRLAGIVSIGDVVKNRMEELQAEQAQLQAYITQEAEHGRRGLTPGVVRTQPHGDHVEGDAVQDRAPLAGCSPPGHIEHAVQAHITGPVLAPESLESQLPVPMPTQDRSWHGGLAGQHESEQGLAVPADDQHRRSLPLVGSSS